jgi:hypothetical protein
VSDQQQTSEYTSFDPSTFVKGGAGWGDNKVRITGAKFIWETWKGNGTPSCQLEIKGIVVGDDDAKERRELYSAGKKAIPTLDGESIAEKDSVSEAKPYGKPIEIDERSNISRFFGSLHNAGFPFTMIQDPKTKRGHISGLVGAVITFKGEEKKDKEGNIKKSADGQYTEYSYWPVAYLKDESQQGGGSGAGVTKANGTPVAAASSTGGDHEQAAKDLVIELLMNADGNTLKRSDMTKLVPAGTPKEVKLLLLKEPFLKSIDGVSYDKGVLSVA